MLKYILVLLLSFNSFAIIEMDKDTQLSLVISGVVVNRIASIGNVHEREVVLRRMLSKHKDQMNLISRVESKKHLQYFSSLEKLDGQKWFRVPFNELLDDPFFKIFFQQNPALSARFEEFHNKIKFQSFFSPLFRDSALLKEEDVRKMIQGRNRLYKTSEAAYKHLADLDGLYLLTKKHRPYFLAKMYERGVNDNPKLKASLQLYHKGELTKRKRARLAKRILKEFEPNLENSKTYTRKNFVRTNRAIGVVGIAIFLFPFVNHLDEEYQLLPRFDEHWYLDQSESIEENNSFNDLDEEIEIY